MSGRTRLVRADRRGRAVVALYAGAVTVLGLGALGALVALRVPTLTIARESEFVLLAALLVVTEMRPVVFRRNGHEEATTISGIFACALLLGWGVLPAVFVQSLASLADDTIARTAWWKRAFNVAQYTLSFGAAGLVLRIFNGGPVDHSLFRLGLGASLVAGLVFFAVNNTLIGIGGALEQRTPIIPFLLDDLFFQASLNGFLAALAPVVLVSAEENIWMVPLLLLPVAAIYRGARVAVEKEHQAAHDALTGLPNRLELEQRAIQCVTDAQRGGRHVAIVMIGLDGMSDLNDTLGHRAGDHVLCQVAPKLEDALRQDDILARFSSDQFVVVVPDLESPLAATARAEALAQAFERPFELEGSAFDLKASVGLAVSPQHGLEVELLLQRSDVAMHLARRNKSDLEVYREDRDQNTRRRLTVLGELRLALDAHDLVVHYQPKADIATGRFVGLEALTRWEHQSLGTIMPDEFIAVAEHSGLIRPLTDYVLGDVIAQACRWREVGIDLPVSVNVSAGSLHDRELPDRLARLLAVAGVPTSSIGLELTETAVMSDPERALQVLHDLRDMSVRVAIDDFGTGYSSLAYLKRLPVDEIKIDKSFVLQMPFDESDRVIVQSTIDLAGNLGLEVVAEGVETRETWGMLADLGCEVAQGYFISRPTLPQDLEPMLLEGGLDVDEQVVRFGKLRSIAAS